MGYVFMIVAGAIVGWLATYVLRADESTSHLQLSIAAGIAGALVGGLVISPAIGAGELVGGRYNAGALIVSIFGALAFSVPFNLLRSRILR